MSVVVLDAFAKSLKATISFVVSACLSFRPQEQLGSRRMDFCEIWYLNIFRKFVDKIQVLFKSDKSNRYFTWRLIYFYDHISLDSS